MKSVVVLEFAYLVSYLIIFFVSECYLVYMHKETEIDECDLE
jgi:hypothetical protein